MAYEGRLDDVCVELGIELLGVFGSAAEALRAEARGVGAPTPHDLDVAVSFRGEPDVLALIDRITELTGCERIDVADVGRADPLLRAHAFGGIGLYETERGRWAIEQMASLKEKWDTAHLRALDRQALTL
jgi:predicted nucleotidyltransferase